MSTGTTTLPPVTPAADASYRRCVLADAIRVCEPYGRKFEDRLRELRAALAGIGVKGTQP